MSDLTKRLRDREPCYPMRSLEIEAADRIEQLEAALREFAKVDKWEMSLNDWEALQDKARALIGEA